MPAPLHGLVAAVHTPFRRDGSLNLGAIEQQAAHLLAGQFRGVQLIQWLAGYGYMGAAKAVMAMLGVDVGPARLPNTSLTPRQNMELRIRLETAGFFDWVK